MKFGIKFGKKNPIMRKKGVRKEKPSKKVLLFCLITSVIVGVIFFISSKKVTSAIFAFAFFLFLTVFYSIMKIKLGVYTKVKKMEDAFPDFLQLMSSNLRAGMTTDRALLMAARKEFYPLDLEIIKLGKELMTGRRVEDAMIEMGERINSPKIKRTVSLIVSGLRSGGNIAILLEETASNSREREFVKKRAASNVLMYVIFIVAALTIGAPGLFALSTILVEVLTNVLSTIPEVQTTAQLPFTLSSVSVSVNFIIYFSLLFLIAISIIGSLVLGLVLKGEERAGVKFMVPIVVSNVIVFFLIRIILGKYFINFFKI